MIAGNSQFSMAILLKRIYYIVCCTQFPLFFNGNPNFEKVICFLLFLQNGMFSLLGFFGAETVIRNKITKKVFLVIEF